MTVKKVTPKTTAVAQAKKVTTVRKLAARRAPAAKPATAPKRAPAKSAPAKAAAPVANIASKDEKKKKKSKKADSKTKVVRDSFTMPQSDYAIISELKQLCQKAGVHVKKSELLRVGLHALSKLTAVQLTQALSSLEKIKTGRPKSNH